MFLHTINLDIPKYPAWDPNGRYDQSPNFNEPYMLVAGLSRYGYPVASRCLTPGYLVPLGADGLPYITVLGAPGHDVLFSFNQEIACYVVVTGSATPPVPAFR